MKVCYVFVGERLTLRVRLRRLRACHVRPKPQSIADVTRCSKLHSSKLFSEVLVARLFSLLFLGRGCGTSLTLRLYHFVAFFLDLLAVELSVLFPVTFCIPRLCLLCMLPRQSQLIAPDDAQYHGLTFLVLVLHCSFLCRVKSGRIRTPPFFFHRSVSAGSSRDTMCLFYVFLSRLACSTSFGISVYSFILTERLLQCTTDAVARTAFRPWSSELVCIRVGKERKF